MKKIVFDFDGVVVNTREMVFEIFKQVYPKMAMEHFLNYFNTGVDKNDGIGFDIDDDFVEYFFREYDKQLGSRYLYDNIGSVLKNLSEKTELFIITGNSEEVVKKFLKKNDLDVFRKILGYEIDTSKREKFKILKEKYSVRLEETVFVTDTLGDVMEGQKAGCRILAETFGYHDRVRLERGKPDWLVDSWGEVVEILR